MTVVIDKGHGINVLGRMSPDGRLKEWQYAKDIALMVVDELTRRGVDARILVEDDYDVKINTTQYLMWNDYFKEKWEGTKAILSRVFRVNRICAEKGSKNVLLVSIHNNAYGNGARWYDAQGFSVFCSKKASDSSKRMAEIFYRNAVKRNLMGNRSVPKADAKGRHFWTWSWTRNDIAILSETLCPAVLTENLFMDNRDDVDFLLSERGKREIVDLHVESIMEYINGKC